MVPNQVTLRQYRVVIVILALALLVTIGAFTKRLSVRDHNEWVARCIISNVDYRPNEGLRAYCENQYYQAKDAGSAP